MPFRLTVSAKSKTTACEGMIRWWFSLLCSSNSSRCTCAFLLRSSLFTRFRCCVAVPLARHAFCPLQSTTSSLERFFFSVSAAWAAVICSAPLTALAVLQIISVRCRPSSRYAVTRHSHWLGYFVWRSSKEAALVNSRLCEIMVLDVFADLGKRPLWRDTTVFAARGKIPR